MSVPPATDPARVHPYQVRLKQRTTAFEPHTGQPFNGLPPDARHRSACVGGKGEAEVCRKYDISSTYAYKLKDRALEVLRDRIGRPVGRVDPQSERLEKRVADLEQLAGDQALAIRYLKKTRGHA